MTKLSRSKGAYRARPSAAAGRRGRRDLSAALAREPELIAALVGPCPGLGGPAPSAVREVLSEAVGRRPQYADLQYFGARALMQVGEDARTEDMLEQALGLNPDYVDALVLRGRLACRQGKNRAGVGYLTRALELGADYADVHKLLGDLRRRLGQTKSARQSYERALRINANFTGARIALDELTG